MIYTAMCKQFKEQQVERFCKEQKRWFYAPYILVSTQAVDTGVQLRTDIG